MIGIDLFAGAGGMSLGAAQAGIDVRLAVEADSHAATTYAHNHPDTEIFQNDIRKLRRINIRSNGQRTILFGGPPCQGFSTSNQRTRNTENPDNWLFKEYIRIARLWKPDWVVFENVKGIVDTENGIFLKKVIKKLQRTGYTTTWWILDSSDYDVPQKRNRVFVIGSLEGIKLQKPEPLTKIKVTVRQAIFDLPELLNGDMQNYMSYRPCRPTGYARMMRGNLTTCNNHHVTRNSPLVTKRYKHIPQGGNWRNIPAKLMKNYTDRSRCHTGIYHRLREDEPSVVIGNYRKNMLIHPNQNRGLSVREAARLQSFPDWYEFKGSLGYQQQQVGNAVPPLLAKKVFEIIIKAAGN